MPSFVTHLESALDGTRYPARTLHTKHKDRPLSFRYDLNNVMQAVSRADLAGRPHTMWRYRELLPYERDEDIISLGETMTPLIRCERLGARLGLRNLYIKDESRLPTGSFKSRGMAMAVTLAKSLGVKSLAVPTAGNAGGALAAYAARAGIACFVFTPRDTPIVNQYECALHGAKTFLVNGLITDCAHIVREGVTRRGWFDMSTLKEPYRLEGKKTMGLELAEQMNWSLPDVILYPTGGGTGLIGMWKAFHELRAIGWLEDSPRSQRSTPLAPGSAGGSFRYVRSSPIDPHDESNIDDARSRTNHPPAEPGAKGKCFPRMFACQSTGCAPIARAFEKGERFAEPFENAHTIASGLRVPRAAGDFMILDAVRESGGAAIAAEESRLTEWMRLACELEGIALCPESAACIGVVEQSLQRGLIDPDETIVLFNTGAAQKYVEAMRTDLPTVDHTNVDWSIIERA